MPLCITSKQNKILLFIIFNYYTYLKVYLLFYPFLYRLLKLTLQKPKKKRREKIFRRRERKESSTHILKVKSKSLQDTTTRKNLIHFKVQTFLFINSNTYKKINHNPNRCRINLQLITFIHLYVIFCQDLFY